MSKKNVLIFVLNTIVVTILCATPFVTFAIFDPFAQSKVILLKPIEAIVGAGTEFSPDIPMFFRTAYKLALGLASALAVVMIVLAGFEYIASESFGGKGEAKEKIKQAAMGIVLLVLTYVLVYTVNPRMLQFSFGVAPRPPVQVDLELSNTPHSYTYTSNITASPTPATESADTRDACTAKRTHRLAQRVADPGMVVTCRPENEPATPPESVWTLRYEEWLLPKPNRTGGSGDVTATESLYYTEAACEARREELDSTNNLLFYNSGTPCIQFGQSTTGPQYRFTYTWWGRNRTSPIYISEPMCTARRTSLHGTAENRYKTIGECQIMPYDEALNGGRTVLRTCMFVRATNATAETRRECYDSLGECTAAISSERASGIPAFTATQCVPVNTP